jgi:putative salt-induced outer membrane protein YdiY
MRIQLAVVLFAALGLSSSVQAVEVPGQPLQHLSQQSGDMFPPLVNPTNHPAWKGAFAVGLTLTRGNSDTLLTTAKIQVERNSLVNELSLGLEGAYGEDNSVINNETLHGYAQDNHFFTRRFFGFLRADALHDGIEGVQYRYTVSPGVGYYLLKQTNMTFAVEAGPSMVVEHQNGGADAYAGFRAAERFEYKLNSTSRLWHSAECIPQVDQFSNYIINAEAGIETDITKKVGLQVYLQDNFVNQPASGLKDNDLRLVSGVAYKF